MSIPEEKVEQLAATLCKAGLAANDEDARQIAIRMLTPRDISPDKLP